MGTLILWKENPDVVATLEEFSNNPLIRLRTMFSPGTHNWLSYIGLFCLFTLEAQYVLWIWTTDGISQKFGFNRWKAKFETLLMFLFWIVLGVVIGAESSFYVIILPMLLANLTQVSYILTQHFLRPLNSGENDPLVNSFSVITHPVVDFIHLNFSYHLEHHLFPSMNSKFAPLVSQILQEHCREQYIRLPYLTVLLQALRTSRVYLNAETLIEPYSGKQVKLTKIVEQMKKNTVGSLPLFEQ